MSNYIFVSGEDMVSKSSIQVQETSQGKSDGRTKRSESGEESENKFFFKSLNMKSEGACYNTKYRE